jgi:pyruvate,water dikinase
MVTLETKAQDTARDVARYLDKYGQQTFTLDFVEPTLREAPIAMLSNLQFMVAGIGNIDPVASQANAQQRREKIAAEALAYFDEPIRGRFKRLYRSATRDSRYREDAMFHMGAAWAVFRPLAMELGRRLVKVGSLSTADDIFYLTNDEVLVAVEPLLVGKPPGRIALWAMRIMIKALFGAKAAENFGRKKVDQEPDLAIQGLKEKAGEQRRLQVARKRLHAPATIPRDLMEQVSGAMTQVANEDENADVISGFATSAGTISAQASVLTSPEDFDRMIPGSILVCPFTTPAWTQLFAQAAGLVTDIGGVGGHGSIVAREYGIPAVMGTGVGTSRISHGQRITVDGDAGTVTLNGEN